MKKIFFAVVSLVVLSSCYKEVPVGPELDSYLINVAQSDWQYSDAVDNNYFVAQVSVPALTENAFDYGTVSLYRTFNYGTREPSQQILPYTRHHEEVVSSTGDVFLYTETIDYEYGIGWLNIYYTLSDFFYEEDLTFCPEAMQFRLVITR